MNLWLAAAVALVCALAGVVLGRLCWRLRTPFWTIGYLVPLLLLLTYALTFPFPGLLFLPPFSWMMMGINKFATLGFAAALVLTTPLSRVRQGRVRALLTVLMGLIIFFVSVWPFLAPMVDRKRLTSLQTTIDANGVCLQSTEYTCGPAAAVTALRRLGLPAEEGSIAILSCTSYQEGTPLDMLADALQKEYASYGLMVSCRVFKSISDLKEAGLTLAVLKYRFLEDHWVTVLEVTDSDVIVGDPAAGLVRVPRDAFAKRWRSIGIVLQRSAATVQMPQG